MEADDKVFEFIIFNKVNDETNASKIVYGNSAMDAETIEEDDVDEEEHEMSCVFVTENDNFQSQEANETDTNEGEQVEATMEHLDTTIKVEQSKILVNIPSFSGDHQTDRIVSSKKIDQKSKTLTNNRGNKTRTHPERNKLCMVPMCKTSSKFIHDKLLFSVPRDKRLRQKYATLSRRIDPSYQSIMYICSDHFDLETDTIVSNGERTLKREAVPTKFDCQPQRIKEPKMRSWGSKLEEMDRKLLQLEKNKLNQERIAQRFGFPVTPNTTAATIV